MTRLLKQATVVAMVMIDAACGASSVRAQARSMPSNAEPAVFTDPAPGVTIRDRRDFPVSGSVADYDESVAHHWHYWVSLVDPRTSEHWPKFYVKMARFSGHVYDRAENPYPEPQPMIIVLLRVDDATNQLFARWLRQPPWPPFPLDPSQIVALVPIVFP